MGPRGLSNYLRYKDLNGIQKRDMVFFRGRTIVVDTSIYMYRFKSEGEDLLYEKFIKLMCIFKKYNINAIFIFDGSSPKVKYDTLLKRKERRETSQKLYEKLSDCSSTPSHILKKIRREKATISMNETNNVKKLIDSYGFYYINAINEADELCAYFVINKMAYACLSDDMDLMLYGVPIVMRYISLLKEEVIVYDTFDILSEINMNLNMFRVICIASGTDYNCSSSDDNTDPVSITTLFKYYENNDKQSIFNVINSKSISIKKAIQIYYVDSDKYCHYQNLNKDEKPTFANIQDLLPNFVFI
tara:strand:- start:636 stop:1541 length:906 start_codon:yes stop_codon:yes gene_type:complete